ncbi:MAG: threonine/serine dehydratase [Actinomycetota bacterium]|nr:threonine/serine dehydratase [Actinomycetota bacterium]
MATADTGPIPRLPIGVDDVRAAAERLDGVAHRTPVLTSPALDELVGAEVFLKCENLQRTGAFKFRGAYNAVSQLGAHELERGVCAPSSGNHAQALALAARLLGSPAVIVMPADAPRSKLEATRAHGAEVVTYDRYQEDREAIASALAEERGLTMISPYEHPDVVAGQGTAALELIEDEGHLDALIAPVSGGGLIAGCATLAKSLLDEIEIVGVEPELGDDTRRSLAAGERVSVPVPRTIADGLAVTTPGELSFAINRRLVDEVVAVSDDEIATAMVALFEHAKVVAEPSGATALAALTSGRASLSGRVGVIVSGGNVDIERFRELTEKARVASRRRSSPPGWR